MYEEEKYILGRLFQYTVQQYMSLTGHLNFSRDCFASVMSIHANYKPHRRPVHNLTAGHSHLAGVNINLNVFMKPR